ncbi:MAG TPA: DUF4340 domain-containing protein [Vicinamibacterales bacterium]|jgi:hypothetical protein|nr:DUF4340 domain-containing protein [Vicinamibacterales bacterium]
MRGLTSTIVLAVVLAGLVGYIYFVDAKKSDSGAPARDKAFKTVEADAIEELQIKSADGERARLRKADKGWQLVEPNAADADASELSSLTTGLTGLEVQRVVDENPADLKQYGLNPPRVEVGFRLKGDKDFRRLEIGEKTPTGGDLYARKPDDKKVFLISSYLDNTFNRTPFDLRDKGILKFERDKVDGIEVVNGPVTLQFTRKDMDWKIVKPIAARADHGAVESLVTRLSSGQMKKLVAAEETDLKQYGLDKPSVTATVSTGSARASLALGKTEKDAAYAKDLSRPIVFTVDPALATDLQKTVGDYRRKDVFEFRSFNANRVEIRRGADTLTFEKTKDKDNKEIWRTASGQTADTTKVEDFLTRLSNLRAQAFEQAQPAAMKSPEITATVRFDESKMETVTLGRSGNDVFAARADEPGAAKLDKTPYEETIKALDALK